MRPTTTARFQYSVELRIKERLFEPVEALRGDHKVAGLRWLHGKGLCHACAHLDVCRKRLLLRLQHGEVLVDRDDSIDVSRKSERGLQRPGSHVHGLQLSRVAQAVQHRIHPLVVVHRALLLVNRRKRFTRVDAEAATTDHYSVQYCTALLRGCLRGDVPEEEEFCL